MTISIALSFLVAVWFLLWGIMQFTGRGRFGNAILGALAVLVSVLILSGHIGFSAG